MNSISVVIPALHEEGVVGKTVKSVPVSELRKLGLEVEILVVDNNSEDNTAAEAKAAGARVVRETRRGYGNAYKRGFAEAKGDIIVMSDADGTYPLERVPELIQPILDGKSDMVVGSRFKGEILPGSMSFLHRRIGNPILTGALNMLFGTRISDTHSGFRAFTKEALARMDLHSPGMEFASEMIIEAANKGLRISEIPIEYRPRGGGKPKLSSFQDGWRHLRFMMLYSPTFLFILPGALVALAGFALVLALIYGPIKIGNMGLDIHPMILGNLLVILGIQIILLGVFTKVFSVVTGINKPGKFMKLLLRYNNLEREMITGFVVFLAGLVIALGIVYKWFKAGFKDLGELRNAILASTLMFVGIQLVFSALFLSVLLLGLRDSDENSLRY
jgi:glycosyltransferase involved in cell wall biosynthesis